MAVNFHILSYQEMALVAFPPQSLALIAKKLFIWLNSGLTSSGTLQCNACSIMCCAVQFSAVQCAVKYTLTAHCRDSDVKFIALKWSVIQCAVHCQCTAEYSVCTTLQCSALKCIVVLCVVQCS